MNTAQKMAIIVAIVGIIRNRLPDIDREIAVLAAVVAGVGLAFLTDTGTWRDLTLQGVALGLTAAGAMQALAYGARKVGENLPNSRGFAWLDSLVLAAVIAGIVALLIVMAYGCAGSFEEARFAQQSPAAERAVATDPTTYCEDLDSRQMLWHGLAAGAGALSSASGLVAIPASSTAQTVLIGTAVGFAAFGATAVVLADGASIAWVRDCSLLPLLPFEE